MRAGLPLRMLCQLSWEMYSDLDSAYCVFLDWPRDREPICILPPELQKVFNYVSLICRVAVLGIS